MIFALIVLSIFTVGIIKADHEPVLKAPARVVFTPEHPEVREVCRYNKTTYICEVQYK